LSSLTVVLIEAPGCLPSGCTFFANDFAASLLVPRFRRRLRSSLNASSQDHEATSGAVSQDHGASPFAA
jgi:hypothetical protein